MCIKCMCNILYNYKLLLEKKLKAEKFILNLSIKLSIERFSLSINEINEVSY